MGDGYYTQIPETKCPNCGRKMHGGMTNKSGVMVCSSACDTRLRQRIDNGMLDADDYIGWGNHSLGLGFGVSQEDTERIRDMRIRIKQLEHRAKAASR